MKAIRLASVLSLAFGLCTLHLSHLDAQELERPEGNLLFHDTNPAPFSDLRIQPLSSFDIRQLDDFRFRSEGLPRTTARVHVEETVDAIGSQQKSRSFGGVTIEFESERYESHVYGDILEEMCDALDSVTFGIVDTERHTHFSIGRAPHEDLRPDCKVVDTSLADAIKDASGTFPEKKLYRWKAGVSGYVLFTNSLFLGLDGDHNTEIESNRLVNLLSMAITDDPGQHRYYDVDRITVREERTDCVCERGLSKQQILEKIANPDQDTCTLRDQSGRVCIGNERKWHADIRDRWYFDPQNLNIFPRTFSSFRSSDLPLFRSDVDPELYVHLWCQIDPYFPCTDIEIQVLGPPPPGDSWGNYQFSEFLAHALCDWDCNTRIDEQSVRPRRTNNLNIRHISVEDTSDWDDFVEQANREIERFSEGQFGFLAIPATVVFDPGTKLSGVLPISNKHNNLNAVEEIHSGKYFLLHDFMITMTSFALENEAIRGFLRYIYSWDSGPEYSCEHSNFECLANMHREKTLRSLWLRPIR